MRMRIPFIPVLLAMMIACGSQVLSQQAAASAQKPAIRDLRTVPGKLLSEGRNRNSSGPLELITYKLEEVPLPELVQVEIAGKRKEFQSVLRLTITSASDLDAHMLWIDDASLLGVWGLGGKGVAVLIYDRSILRDGGVISVSKGGHVYELPEQLQLPESMKTTFRPETIEDGNTYTLRSVLRIIGSERQPLVEIELRTNRSFPILDAAYGVQIGKRLFPGGAFGHAAVASLTPAEFAQLKDGERIAISTGWVNYAALGTGAWYFGRLNKSKLDR
jgi:hypothetical protein